MTLIQGSPEVRELDVNALRLALKGLEDDPDGMPFPSTHNHNTEITLAGLTYARAVEIINGYTVQFEDGQYTVNCVGANHNLSDVKVANQVSLIVNNAAGLITNPAIEYSSFNGGVTVNTGSAYSGTVFPVGTPQRPVNNMADALLIASTRGLTTFYIQGDITISEVIDIDDYIFVGESMARTEITIDSDANCVGCEFYDAHIIGTLDGGNFIKNCKVTTLTYVNGIIEQCLLASGIITLGGNVEAHFLDCWAGVAGVNTPTIDMGGSGQALAVSNYNGDLTLKNKSGASDTASVEINAGKIILESTVTAGIINCRGIGKLCDTSGNNIPDGTWNGATIINDLLTQSIEELHKNAGLSKGNPLTITPTSRSSDGINLVIGGDGESQTTVTRQ